MKRAWVIAGVLLRSAARGVQTSPVPAAVAVGTIAVALLLVGAFALVVDNMQGLLARMNDELQVVAYLEPGLEPAAERRIAERAGTIEGVAQVRLVTRAEALERFREALGGARLLEGLEENPLPASIEIELEPAARTAQGIAIVAAALDGLPGVDELAYGQQWMEGYARATALVRSGAVVLGVVLGLAALLIVANTIRLAVYAREDEVEILSLVGAGRTFVRTPFLLEGAAQGALGGAVALLLLFVGFHLLVPKLQQGLVLLLGQTAPRFFAGTEAAMLVGAGAALGMLGSALAMLGWRR